jgi:hypothetical protein
MWRPRLLVMPDSTLFSSDIQYDKRLYRRRGVVSGKHTSLILDSDRIAMFSASFWRGKYDMKAQLERCKIIINNTATEKNVASFWFSCFQLRRQLRA